MKVAAYGIPWVPVNLVETQLQTKWKLLDYTHHKLDLDDVIKKRPEVVISFSPPKKLLNIPPKWLISPGAGIDSLDIDLIKEKSIKLVNSHANANTVAEHAWALLLTASRNIIKYHNKVVTESAWPSPSHIRDFNYDLQGKTAGILGYGAIGKRVEQYAKAFDMNTMIFRLHPSEGQYLTEQLIDMASELDFLIICIPLTRQTYRLINEQIIERLPGSCIVVNISRGAVVDEKYMFDALIRGKIFSYASDVWENSPYRPDGPGVRPSEFVGIPGLIISPHRAWASATSISNIAKDISNTLDTIARGENPKNIVDINRGY